ncbi:MAG TPA: TolC family protein [Gemmatimonadaceae bacterium]
MSRSWSFAFVGVTLIAGACARRQSYRPAPIAPVAEAERYADRRLRDPALARFLAEHEAALHDSAWSSRQLALAALYFRADVTEAQRTLAAARAAEITAGARPAPSATATADRAERPDEGNPTPWSFSLTAGWTLELGGKRAARIAHARAVTLASRLRLEADAWEIAQSARQAAVVALGAKRELADASAERAGLDSVRTLLHARFVEGRLTSTDVARAETDVQTSAVAVADAARANTAARIALARTLAVPLREVESLPIREESNSACAALDTLAPDSLEARALTTRADVGAALADYSAAEADLALAIAQQYPDITIGPGIAWEQGIQRWVLSLAIPSIAVNRARGPIAEARARRAAQAARVAFVQDSILAAVDSSVAACRTTRADVASADSLVSATRAQLALANAAYQRGEIGQTEIAFAHLAVRRAERTREEAVRRGVLAGIMLEQAAGSWLSGPPIRWPDLLRVTSNP